jgi:glycosyltransferase 2 family protein
MDLKKLSPVLGLALLGIILYSINLRALGAVLSGTHPGWLLLAGILALVSLPLMALRWHVLCVPVGLKSPYAHLLTSVAKGVSLGTVTPGKLGELYRAKYLATESGGTIGAALATVVVDRVLDLAVLVITGCVAAALLTHLYLVELPMALILAICLAALAGLTLLIKSAFVRKLLVRIAEMITKRSDIHLQVKDFTRTLSLIGPSAIMRASIITLFIWSINVLCIALILQSLSISVPLWFVALVFPLIGLFNLLPISVSGFGTTQMSAVALLGLRGIGPEPAVAFSLLYIVVGIWFYAVPGIVLYLMRK